jgi:hypothetical protein
MATPNILSVSTINGNTTVAVLTASAITMVNNAAASGKIIKLNALYISNSNTSNNNSVTVDVYRSSTAYRIATNVTIPIASTLDLISKSLYLLEGDALRVTGSATSSLEAVCSFEEIS